MGTKNTLMDLNDHLFEQMERLNDDDLTAEELGKEINRAKAMTDVASQIVDVADITLKAYKFKNSYDNDGTELPRMLVGDKKKPPLGLT